MANASPYAKVYVQSSALSTKLFQYILHIHHAEDDQGGDGEEHVGKQIGPLDHKRT